MALLQPIVVKTTFSPSLWFPFCSFRVAQMNTKGKKKVAQEQGAASAEEITVAFERRDEFSCRRGRVSHRVEEGLAVRADEHHAIVLRQDATAPS